MRIQYAIFALLLLSTWSCRKPEPEPIPPPPNTGKLEILWQQLLSPDSLIGAGEPQYVWNHHLITGVGWLVPEAIQLRDGYTGEIIWSYDDFISPFGSFNKNHTVFDFDGYTLLNQNYHKYCINNTTGTLVWSSTVKDFDIGTDVFACRHGDYMYNIHITGTPPNVRNASLVRVHYLTGQFDTLVSIAKDGQYASHLNPSALWVSPQGDSILVFEHNEYWVGALPAPNNLLTRSHLRAFNLRTRQFEWNKMNFDELIGWPVFDGDKLYICDKNTLFCLQASDGAIVWSRDLDQGKSYLGTAPVVYQNVVAVQSDQVGMWGVDKNTGTILWQNSDTDGQAWELTEFEGVIYFTSSGYARLYAIDALTGATIWKERSPNRKYPATGDASFFESPIAIDAERKVLFVSDKYFLMCIKLPR